MQVLNDLRSERGKAVAETLDEDDTPADVSNDVTHDFKPILIENFTPSPPPLSLSLTFSFSLFGRVLNCITVYMLENLYKT